MSKHGIGEGAFIYVADSAMVTKENLAAIGSNLFVSRLPATNKECERTIGLAVDMAGCFVLLSNVTLTENNALTAAGLLRTYKGQYGVESDFAFLKDPLIVNDIFLKKPSRIDALGMVLIIALMVWRLMERNMRKYVETTGTQLPGWAGRLTYRPTSFMMTTIVRCITVLKIENHRHLLRPLKAAPGCFYYSLGAGLKCVY